MDERNLNIEKERRIFRKAKTEDISAIVEIYSQIHEAEGKFVCWMASGCVSDS